jgi:hydrogenase maturation protease
LSALVIGYGSALRRDDAAGLHVARAVAACAPAAEVVEVALLVPELAERVAQAECVVFVDAAIAPAETAPSADGCSAVTTAVIEPLLSPPLMAHVTSPRALVALAARLFGRAPPAWIVTVPAFDTTVGEGLSRRTAALRDAAVAAVLTLLAPDDRDRG